MRSRPLPTRQSIKVLLINPEDKLLLMGEDNPQTTASSGTYHGAFWHCIGGKIEKGEDVYAAAKRELFEEAGLGEVDVWFGPIVWHGSFILVINGEPTTLHQQFVVARTCKTDVRTDHIVGHEHETVTGLRWFSLEELQTARQVIYPVDLPRYLPDIIAGNYPKESIRLDLGKQPD